MKSKLQSEEENIIIEAVRNNLDNKELRKKNTATQLLWYRQRTINHFTAVCLVAWPLNESEAGVDHDLIETSLLFYAS